MTKNNLVLFLSLLSLIRSCLCQVSPTSSTALSETYNVLSTEYQNTTITCTKQSCIILCDTISGCLDLQINATGSETLSLTCSSTDSCKNVIISSAAQISTTIQCKSTTSCEAANFHINSPSVSVTCDYFAGATSSLSPCYQANIHTEESTNVTLNCLSSYSCFLLDLYCPTNNGTCNTECGSLTRSCAYINIFTPNEKTVNINCDSTPTQDDTCYSTDIYCGDNVLASRHSTLEYITLNEKWNCDNELCCPINGGKINCPMSAATCDVDCNSMDCRDYLIDGSSVQQQLTVNCSAQNGGCNGAFIQCPDEYSTATCVVYCEDAGSCDSVTVQASNVDVFALNCTGSEACNQAKIYCPSDKINACNINCNSGDYRVCYDMEIYSDNFFVQNYLSLNCGANNMQDECTRTSLTCESSSTITVKTAVDLYFDSSEYEWECDYKTDSYCCPWLNTEPINCQTDSSCYIDCSSSDCAGVIINASMSNYLSLDCGTSECSSSIVYCPAHSDCIISCSSEHSCDSMVVHANNSNNVQIECSYHNGCDNMTVFAMNVNELSFDTKGYKTSYVNLYADNATSMILKCRGDYACKYLNVYGDNVGSISIDAGYSYGFSYGEFKASNAGAVTISCASQRTEYGCYNIDWYLPDYGYNTIINCYGNGCDNFGDIYIVYSMEYITLNVNGCDECSSESSCVGSWSIYCKTSEYATTYSYAATYYGSSCSRTCGCDEFSESVTFTDDDKDAQCITSNTTDISSASAAAIIGSVFGAIFCICFIAILICACGNASRRQRYGRYWGRTNYVAPAPGIQPAVAQPISQKTTVVQPVQQQQIPVVMMVQPQQPMNQIQYVPVQPIPQRNVQYVTAQPQQPQHTVGSTAQPIYANPSNVNVPQAAPYNPSAPPSYNYVEQASAPPAYGVVDNDNHAGEDGAETNY